MNKKLFQRALDECYDTINSLSKKASISEWRKIVLVLKNTHIKMYPWWLKIVKKIQGKDVNATTIGKKIYLHPNWFAQHIDARSAILIHEYWHTQGYTEDRCEAKEQMFRKLYKKFNAKK